MTTPPLLSEYLVLSRGQWDEDKSPEQIQQQPLDGRSDLFSLGSILFECLTGRRAFVGAQNLDVLGQVLHVQPPAPSTVRRELDDRHDELCRRLLAKDPAERFQSAEEVVGALRTLQPDLPAVTPATGSATLLAAVRAQWKRLIVAALVVAAVATGIWRVTRSTLPAAPPEAAKYYRLGTEALREGTYQSASAALSEAVRLFPDYALAHARLAEAHAEMDDGLAASQDLVRVAARTEQLPVVSGRAAAPRWDSRPCAREDRRRGRRVP